MTPNNPSKPVPLEAEAVEAAAKAIETELDRAALLEHGADGEVVEGVIDLAARLAIHAADEARGMRVEITDSRGITTGKQRLVSAWFPIKGPVDE